MAWSNHILQQPVPCRLSKITLRRCRRCGKRHLTAIDGGNHIAEYLPFSPNGHSSSFSIRRPRSIVSDKRRPAH
jgi:hypothetical protein